MRTALDLATYLLTMLALAVYLTSLAPQTLVVAP